MVQTAWFAKFIYKAKNKLYAAKCSLSTTQFGLNLYVSQSATASENKYQAIEYVRQIFPSGDIFSPTETSLKCTFKLM